MTYEDVISETAKKYLQKEQIKLEDWQKAWLIYHSSKSLNWKQNAMEQLADETEDEELKGQIRFQIKKENAELSVFQKNKGNAIYILKEWYEDEPEPTEMGFYADFLLAEKMADKLKFRHTITKVELIQNMDAEIYETFDGSVHSYMGTASYNGQGEMTDITSCELEQAGEFSGEPENMFWERYFKFRSPFRKGDILREAGCEEKDYIRFLAHDPEYEDRGPRLEKCLDDSDSGILVNRFDRETGTMWDSDEWENPYRFDYYEISPDTKDLAEQIILEWQKLLQGNGGSIQFIQDGCRYLREAYEESHKRSYISGFQLREKQ